MPDTRLPTRLELRTVTAIARRFVAGNCDLKHEALQRAVRDAASLLDNLRDAGLGEKLDAGDLLGVRAVLLDALSDAHGRIINEADEAGINDTQYPLDLAEVRRT